MKIIKEPAIYGSIPISRDNYIIQPERNIYETDLKIKFYKGFKVEFVEHLTMDKKHYRFIIKKINGEKVNIHYSEVRNYIDDLIKRVFERINGVKVSVENDRLFVRAIKQTDELDVVDSLLLNARYNFAQFNYCFEYLYKRGISIQVLCDYISETTPTRS
tara:strand:+ start:2586 stop:3065 length:480 start_codon:yes stop_codon:yes gene_type:complete